MIRAVRSALAGLAFYAGPIVLVAGAVSARSGGLVDSCDAVAARVSRHLGHAREAARAEDVPLDLLLAVACVESAGREGARSGAGAVGLMQLMPETAAEIAAERGEPPPDLTDPRTSLRLGARYLRAQLDLFAGRPSSTELALCAYNAGPGAVRRWIDAEPVPEGDAGISAWIPYSETRAFVRRVRDWRERWRLALSGKAPDPR